MKKFFLVAIFATYFLPHFVHADVVITEVMYDAPGTDADHEWIEIYNDGSASETMVSWKFFEEGSNHGIADAGSGGVLPAGEYAVIVSNPSIFKSDYPSFSGIVFDSSWSSFNNSGEALALKDSGGNVEFQFTYDPSIGAAGDGQTLQYVSGSWTHGLATPGAENEESDTTDTGGETIQPQEEEQDVFINTYKPAAKIILVGESIAGSTTRLHAVVTNKSNNEISPEGIFDWNFGDGTGVRVANSADVAHQYENPGEYSVWLGYKRYESMVDYQLSTRFKVVVKEGGVVLSRVISGSGVELFNQSTTDKDISFWSISQNGNVFSFPPNTILLSGKKIIFSTRALGFSPSTEEVMVLNYPNGVLATTYQKTPLVVPKLASVASSSSSKIEIPKVSSPVVAQEETIPENTESNLFLAAAASSVGDEEITKTKNYLPYLLGLILLGVVSVIVLRRTELTSKENTAEEITILE